MFRFFICYFLLLPTIAQVPLDSTRIEIKAIRNLYDNYPDSAAIRVINLLKNEQALDDSLKYESYFLAGEVLDNISLHTIALDYHLKAIEIRKALGHEDLLPNYSEVFELYTSLRDTLKCTEYLEMIVGELDKSNTYDAFTVAEAYYDLGTYYWYFKQYDESIEAMLQSIAVIENQTPIDKEYLVYVKMEKAEVHFLNDQISEMDQLLEEVLGDTLLDTYTRYARNYVLYIQALQAFAYRKYDLSFQLLDSLMEEVESMNLLEEKYNILGMLTELHSEIGNFDEAYNYMKLREETYFQIHDQEKRMTLQILDTEYDLRDKNQRLSYQETFIGQQRKIIYTAIASIVLILLVLGVVLFLFRKIRLKNQQIETLMRELHHRVKNNLQVISSLLGLQSSKLQDASAQKAVEEGKERIRAMSLIHQKLYQQSDVSNVNLKEYLEALVAEITESYGFTNRADLQMHIAEVPMDVDTTMPLGLIVNELVSNAFKYAYGDIETPLLKLEVVEKANRQYQLLIKDNGKGLPMHFDFDKATSFGLKLVKLLVRQLGAKLEIDHNEGLEYKIEFRPA